jgi:serine/threonine-protein kinase
MKPALPAIGKSLALQAGARVGPYRLIEEIGKGGMGRVFLAERADGAYEQRVALKLINKSEDDEELLPRFYQERQALAMLAHPNIARLLGGGVTEDGQPYLVMEYIEGVPLDVYCDEQQCDTPTRVRLFREVLAGVQHAHQHFLVHRDLKPGNILVTAEGVPKLLDFGIVKWLQASGGASKLSVTGAQPMTLEYASPEQVKGDAITTVSDVYALGVLLYELLTGHSPYRKSTNKAYDLQKAVCEEEPEAPSAAVNRVEQVSAADQQTAKTLTPETVSARREGSPQKLRRRLAGDLDSIVLKALRKEPQRRYSSAEQFSEDLQRYLEGGPVSAREATFTYRAAKFVRLHKFGVGAATLVLLLSFGFGLAMSLQVERTKSERDKAEQVSKFLADIFTASDPNHSKGDSVTARELLDRGAEQARKELQDQPELQARLLDQIGDIYRKLDRFDRAEPLLREALGIRRRHFGDMHTEVTASLYSLGTLLYNQGKYAQAETLQREALSTNRKLLGNQHYDVGVNANELGLTLMALGKLAEAESLFREAEAILRRLPRLPPEKQQDLAGVLNNLGLISEAKKDYPAAEREFREVLEMARQILPAGNPTLAFPLKNLAVALCRQDKHREAEPLLHEALPLLQNMFPDGHWVLASVQSVLGECLLRRQEYQEAERLLLNAHDYFQKHPEHEEKLMREAQEGLVRLYKAWGKPQKAEEFRLFSSSTQNASN